MLNPIRIRKTRIGALIALAMASAFPLGNLHPYFTVKHILPAELNDIRGIGGIGLLPNGDGVICTWGGSQQPSGTTSKSNGEVWILPKLADGSSGTPVRIAMGLREPLGVAVVGSDFYVMEKPRISKFTGSGTSWTKSTLWSLPTAWYNDNQWHHFSFNLVPRDDAFWFTTGTAYDYDSNDAVQRGALIKVAKDGSGFTQLARGLRNTNGIGLGPDNEFFATENQGHWKPADALYHLPTANVPANGRFFGFRTKGNNACGTKPPSITGAGCPDDPEYPPAIWIPYGGFSNSPTRPILLKSGPYAGQMISGDVYHGGTLRYFLEKVNGEWQGAVFPFMTAGAGGVNFGINQYHYTPSGALLAIGIGGGDACKTAGSGNWAWNSTCRGLDLLTPTDKAPFEMLAIRSVQGGFDVELTQPAGEAAANKANWTVKTTVFSPVLAYGVDGGPSDNNVNVAVANATLSADKKHVRLELATMLTRRMYAITMNNVSSASGEAAYANVGYYTLNNTGTATAIGPVAAFSRTLRTKVQAGRISLDLPFQGHHRVTLFGLKGAKLAEAEGQGPQTFATGRLSPGIYLVAGTVEGAAFREKVRVE